MYYFSNKSYLSAIEKAESPLIVSNLLSVEELYKERATLLRERQLLLAERELLHRERELLFQEREQLSSTTPKKIKKSKHTELHHENEFILRTMWKNSPSRGGKKMKDIIFHEDKVCLYCQEKTHLTLDHIVPLSRGGKNFICNLAAACIECNRKKGRLMLEERQHKFTPSARLLEASEIHRELYTTQNSNIYSCYCRYVEIKKEKTTIDQEIFSTLIL